MQSTVANTIKLIRNNSDLGKKFPMEVIPYLLKAVENSDAKLRNDIENQIVKIGESGIPTLVNALQTATGSTKALIAMALIRIGKSSINHLRTECKNAPEFSWIADYIINEIEGSRKSLETNYEFATVLVG